MGRVVHEFRLPAFGVLHSPRRLEPSATLALLFATAHSGMPTSRILPGHTIAAPRLAYTSVPAVRRSNTIVANPHSETVGTGACSGTSATRNPT